MTEADYKKMRYYARKKDGVCVRCGREDAYTMAGRSYCAECVEKMNEINKRYRENHPKANHDKCKKRRDTLNDKGLCERCGKRAAKPGRKLCETCMKKMADKNRDKKIANGMNWPRGDNGICWNCNRENAIPGKRLCVVCYEKSLINMKCAHDANKKIALAGIKHFWKYDNENVFIKRHVAH